MPKSSKRFVLSSERLNSHGFVVVTSGIDLTDFKNNPIMYWMHNHPNDDDPTKGLPIGYWDEIEIEGKVLSAVPVFDDSDAFAMGIYNKVEHGTLRAASVGIDPIDLDENKSHWVTGQTLPTMLKSKLMEASIVDRPSNGDAVTYKDGTGAPTFLRLSKNSQNVFLAPKPSISHDQQHSTPFTLANLPTDLQAIVNNAVEVGKYTRDTVNRMVSLAGNDPERYENIKELMRCAPVKMELAGGKFDPYYVKMVNEKSIHWLQNNCGLWNEIKNNAYPLYLSKYIQENGKMPPVLKASDGWDMLANDR